MKNYIGVFLLSAFFSFPVSLFAQLDVYRFIGKSQTQLIKELGNPAHIDNSNPSMVMIFYRNSDLTRSFVTDKSGIYQAEAYQPFGTEKSCKAAVNNYLSDLINKGFSIDTLSVTEFNAGKPGVNCVLNFGLNNLTKNYVIYVSAKRKES